MTAVQETSISTRIMWIGNTIFHQSIAVITVFLFWTTFYYFGTTEQWSWHIVFSTLAYIPLMAEAIVLFATDNVWSQNMSRTYKYYVHGMILFISAIFVTVGNALMIDVVEGQHFATNHSWTGLVSWVFVLLSQFLGLAAINPQRLSKIIPPVLIKLLHNIFGMIGYIFGIVSIGYALVDKEGYPGATSKDACLAITYVLGIAVCWSLLAALKSAYSQIKSISQFMDRS